MAGSNEDGIHMSEDEILASIDFEQMDGKQRERYERILKVNEMSPYKTQEEIAKDLGVGLRTSERDMQFIRKFISDRWVNDLAHSGYSKMTMDFTTRNEDTLRKLYKIRESYSPHANPKELGAYLATQAEIDKIEVMLVEMTGAGPALQSMKKAVSEKEELKKHDI